VGDSYPNGRTHGTVISSTGKFLNIPTNSLIQYHCATKNFLPYWETKRGVFFDNFNSLTTVRKQMAVKVESPFLADETGLLHWATHMSCKGLKAYDTPTG
jgi:hypothetical protein